MRRFPCRTSGVLMVGGLASLALWAWIARLSGQFIWGESHLDRPIVEVVIGLLLAFVVYGWVWHMLRRGDAKTWHVEFIIGLAIAFRLVLLPTEMIQESDAYRYLWDGHVQQAGISPYQYTPHRAELILQGYANGPEELVDFADTLQDNEDAKRVLRRVSYGHLVTIYPPVAQAMFRLAATVTPWRLSGLRLIMLAFDLLTLGVIGLALIDRPAASRNAGLLLYAWSPLVLKEVVNAIHYDSLLALTLSSAALLFVSAGRPWRSLAGSLVLGLAVAAKLYPLLLVPIVFAYQARRRAVLALSGLAITLITVIVAYSPYMLADHGSSTGSLDTFMTDWERNASIHPLLQSGLEALGIESLAPLLPEGYREAASSVATSAVLGCVIVGVVLWFAARVYRADSPSDLLLSAFIVVPVFAWCLSPVQNPWYLVGIVPLLAMHRRPMYAIVFLTGIVALRYLHFHFEYRDFEPSDAPRMWVVTAQFAPFYLLALVEWLMMRRRRSVEPQL